jgi:O-antigen/teichoic acid export membrane protein
MVTGSPETPDRPRNGTKEGAIRRYLVVSTLSNYAGQIVTTGVWFALTPFILHRLGPTQYGLWALVASFVAYGQLLDFGIGAAVTKYVAELRARDDPDEASRVVATALRLYVAIGSAAAALSVPFGLIAPTILNLPADRHATLSWLVILSGIGVGIQLPASTSYAVLRGLQRYDLINLISALAMLAVGLATVAVLLLGGGVVGMVAIGIPLTLFWQLPTIFLVRRIAPELRFGWRGARRELVRTVASFSWAVFVSNTAGRVKTKTDEVVIAAVLPIAQVTPYAVARRVSDLPELTSYQFVRVLMPLASSLHGEEDHDRLRRLYVASTRFALAIFVAVGGGLVVLAGPLLAAWLGDEYADSAHLVLILTAAGMLDIVLWPAASVLQGMGRHRPTAVFAAAGAGLNLGLSILLIHRMGITGVALGTLIATAVEVLVFLPYAMSLNRVPVRTVAADILAPALAPGVLMLAALLSLRELLEPSSLLAVAGLGAAGVLLYAFGFLSFSVNRRERQAVLRAVAATVARGRAALGRQALTRPRKL